MRLRRLRIRILRYIALSCLFLLVSLSSSSAHTFRSHQQASSWDRFWSKGEEFSALLPAPPTKIAISRPLDEHEKAKPPGRMYGAYGDGIVYLILSFDNPNGREALEVFIDEVHHYPTNARANIFEKDVNLDGFRGKQFRYGSSILKGVVQFYAARNHVYILVATGEDLSKPGPDRFFASLRLKRDSVGKEIPDEGFYENLLTEGAPPAKENTGADQTGATEMVLSGKQVTRKALVVAKPEPSYTEEARQKQTTGTVVLRAVFSSSGKVTRVQVFSGLPHGLTERAIIAARNLKFIPALKDGKYVSMYIQLEYNFHLY
jgi:TonB family protein